MAFLFVRFPIHREMRQDYTFMFPEVNINDNRTTIARLHAGNRL
ncbi:hypothetical protein PATA110615_22855 [Paenibacillus taichungensis]